MSSRTTIIVLLALSATLATQALAADEGTLSGETEVEEATSSASDPAQTASPAQGADAMDAATRVFATQGDGAQGLTSTARTKQLQSKEEIETTEDGSPEAPIEKPTEEAPTESPASETPETDQPDREASQGRSTPHDSPTTNAAVPATPAEPAMDEPRVAAPLPSVRSMAEGQAQRTRAAAAEVAAQESFVSIGPALRVEMVFGQSWPTLVCKYNLTCLMELEPGEEIADTQILADSVRWEAALRYREKPVQQAYIAFKPRPDAEETNFVLVTDRRVYSLLLVPDANVHTPILSFIYPDTEAAEMAQRIETQKRAKQARAVTARATRQAAVRRSGVPTTRGAVPADELDFNYRMTGRARFKPVRIYTDGRRTYIDLPERYRGDLPVLIVGGGETNSAVNIQVGRNGTQIIADKMLTVFALVVGRQRVSVRKGK